MLVSFRFHVTYSPKYRGNSYLIEDSSKIPIGLKMKPEEQARQQIRVANWLRKYGIERHQLHHPTHAKDKNLFEIVEGVDA